MTEDEEFEFRHRLEREQTGAAPAPTAELPNAKPAPTAAVVQNAAYGGVAGIPDTLLNAPTRLWNMVKAGSYVLNREMGKLGLGPEFPAGAAPQMTQDPDYARRLLEYVGLINPAVVPHGAAQKALDVGVRGAVGGALTGGSTIPQVLTSAGMGALSSGAAAATEGLTGNKELGIAAGLAAPAGAARLFAGKENVSNDARKLAEEGVSMTPGQISGGTLKRIEDAITSIPIAGDVVKAAQRRGLVSFSNAALNRALAPVGEKLPSGLKGNDAVSYVQDTLGGKYDSLLANVTSHLDRPANAKGSQPTLRGDLGQVLGKASAKLPDEQYREFEGIVQREVVDVYRQNGGRIDGESLKKIESQLSSMATTMRQSQNYKERDMAAYVREAKDAVHETVARQNPDVAKDLKAVDNGWMNFKRAQRAASTVGSDKGVFTPAQLLSATRALDRSKDKSASARGEAPMQDLAQAGKSTLASSVPDSGTATRAVVEAGALGGLGHLLNPAAGATALGAMSIYSPPVQALIQRVMLGSQGPAVRQGAQRSVIPLAAQQQLTPEQIAAIYQAVQQSQRQR